MPRQQGTSVQNKFIKGLITENTALSFPEDACTETFNCVFDETGRITRRLGFEFENNHEMISAPSSEGEVFTEYLWQAVREEGAKTIVVQQRGNIIYFFETTNSVDVSANQTVFTLDLDTYIADDSPRDPGIFACQYASGIGNLLIVNPACDPINAAYNVSTGVLDITVVDVKHRDFDGLDDGLDDDARPTESVATLQANNPEHYYNILNQGWYIGDALSQWDTARTDMPSNQDYVSLYRSSDTDAFDNTRVTAQSTGNTLAAKGHFLLTAWNLDRYQAVEDAGLGTLSSVDIEEQLGTAVGTPFENHGTTGYTSTGTGSNLAAIFNGATSTIAGSGSGKYTWVYNFGNNVGTARNVAIGKDFSTNPIRISRVKLKGGSDWGFTFSYNVSGDPFQTVQPTITLTLRASNTAPTNSNFTTHGTSLGSSSSADTNDETAGRQVSSSDTDTFWNYVWVVIGTSAFETNFGNAIGITELDMWNMTTFTSELEETYTIERPSCVEFFAGRAWYAGINTKGRGNKVYFSQIVEKPAQFGMCYQKNDPTAEDFSDFLPSDGGVLRIPEMAAVKRLFAYQNSLLIFASNGVWQVQGSNNNAFLPTDYVIRRLSSVGTLSPQSFVSFKGVPVWWGEDGIYTVKFDSNYGSFEIINITDNTIASFIKAIPEYNRQFVKGAYDVRNTTVYFLYNDSEDLTGNEYVYNNLLVSNGLTGAFYPWTLDTSDTSPQLRGLVYTIDGSGVQDPVVKFTVSVGETISYAEPKSITYKDWSSSEDTEVDYTSYFITGYKLDGKAHRYFQSNYVWVFLENEDNAGAFMQGIWDFTNSGSSGKWSSKQQIYMDCLENRDVNHRRLKVRGKGKALQLKFTSEPGKPFTIIGWAIWETINAAP